MTKALSIKQPFATAIILGHKRIENRTWRTGYRGTLAIHTGRTMATSGPTLDKIITNNWHGLTGNLDELPRGAILGTVELVAITTEADENLTRDDNYWAIPGQYHWHLRNPIPARRPISMAGKVGLFDLEQAILELGI